MTGLIGVDHWMGWTFECGKRGVLKELNVGVSCWDRGRLFKVVGPKKKERKEKKAWANRSIKETKALKITEKFRKRKDREKEKTKLIWQDIDRTIDRYWCFMPSRSTAKGKTKCIGTTCKNYDPLYMTLSTVEDWRSLGKMKLNESGGQRLGR